MRLPIAVGINDLDVVRIDDLALMPHLMIVGTTGSGKSVLINSLVASLALTRAPSDVRLVLFDPTRLELGGWRSLPHLLAPPLHEADELGEALGWLVSEVDGRERQFAQRRHSSVEEYNAGSELAQADRLPYIAVLIDALHVRETQTEPILSHVRTIASRGRAVGIHLVVALDRAGHGLHETVRANFPARVAFRTITGADSALAIDRSGAERLEKPGKLLYLATGATVVEALRAPFLSDHDMRQIIEHWSAQAAPAHVDLRVDTEPEALSEFGWLARVSDDDLAASAAELVMQTGKASTSMIQTKLKIGFNRAIRLMDSLERFGIVGPLDPRNPAAPRHVYGPDNWVRGSNDSDW